MLSLQLQWECSHIFQSWFITPEQYNRWLEWLEDQGSTTPTPLVRNERTGKDLRANGKTGEDRWANQKGTVGAVAIDALGNLAAGTSTGGITGKLPGRVGDTPGVGHGVFADNDSVGVSCTGVGEAFIKVGVARRVGVNVQDWGMTPDDAINEALDFMSNRVGGDGGVIALSAEDGQVGIGWNSEQMSWAYGVGGTLHYGVNVGEDFEEPI